MIIKFSQTTKFPLTGGGIWDYPMPDKTLGISFQTLEGRGPEKNQYLNNVCHEIYFIIKGHGTFVINGKKHDVKEKDVIVIEPNIPHYIETQHLEYITITRPDWYEEQYEEVS